MTEFAERLTAALGDRYRIERELGQGGWRPCTSPQISGMTAEWRSRCCGRNSPRSSAPNGFSARSRPSRACSIPHILGSIDSGQIDGSAFYVMPFVEGESLRDAAPAREAAPDRRGGAHRDAGSRGARLRAPARRDPSRHQAGEHPAARRPGAGGGLRDRARRERAGGQPDDRDGLRSARRTT